MRLTKETLLSLHALAVLAHREGEGWTAGRDIAARAAAPLPFLLKALRAMVRAGLVRSMPGPHGGFRLARPPGEVSVLEVIEAVAGPVRGAVPEVGNGAARARGARLQALCDQAAGEARARLAKASLADLMDAKTRKKG